MALQPGILAVNAVQSWLFSQEYNGRCDRGSISFQAYICTSAVPLCLPPRTLHRPFFVAGLRTLRPGPQTSGKEGEALRLTVAVAGRCSAMVEYFWDEVLWKQEKARKVESGAGICKNLHGKFCTGSDKSSLERPGSESPESRRSRLGCGSGRPARLLRGRHCRRGLWR